MNKVILLVAAMVIAEASALAKTAHRKAYSNPSSQLMSLGGSANSASVSALRKPVGINPKLETKALEAKEGETKAGAKQPDERVPEAISGTAGEVSSGQGVAKDPARGQALRYTEESKLDSGSRLKCKDLGNGTMQVTTKTGKSFTAPIVDGTADIQRASHMETNGVTFLKANGLKSPADAARNGFLTVEPPGGIDFVRDLAPKDRAAFKYYYPTTLQDQQAMLAGRSFTINKLVVRKLGNDECDAMAGGGGGGGEEAQAPSTNGGGA